ncbi:hypothetical protein VW29_20810 [Devosia limi DSM 17137]|uniref:Uncharacterized protein n=1 Tax=Devosia limi DSM 17137 TaxID=1121477 RepID=A0A0F5L1V8_9HYPH|nr:hypothetical protein [Devosia limi]KKB76189.1 hypothetical protein VW29_20810 [Devosia limi DSM 17137]SHF19792.1 hypothetical protein SAMN02745223_02025 [Devosia limi DSM 17137]
MTFKYSLTIPALGSHKLKRFNLWAAANLPGLAYSLPVQTPIKTENMTIRLRSEADKAAVLSAFPATLP